MTARHCPSWADFQPELVGLVLRRLPSLADRVRLGAVCRSWRRAARLEPVPPPSPWLALLDGTFLSVPDGEVHRAPATAAAVPPGDNNSARCHGSVGSWLFLERANPTSGGARSMSLVNLFSGDTVPLPDVDTIWRHEPVINDDHDATRGHSQRPMVYKPLVSLFPSSMAVSSSPDSLFAVLITDGWFESVISICNSSAAAAFRVPRREQRISDVAFLDGKLYALSRKKLFVFEVDSIRRAGEPKIPTMECIDNDLDNPGVMFKTIAGEMYRCAYWTYLVESRGKLLRVMRLVGHLSTLAEEEDDYMGQSRTFSFEVFEAELTPRSCVKWRRLHSLGGEALFVGLSSKSLPASDCGAQPDCIYFMCDYDLARHWRDPLRDCGVFNMRDGTITPLLPGTMVMRPNDNEDSDDEFYLARVRPGWFFPC